MSKYLRKILLDIPPYIPGRSIADVKAMFGLERIHKLASNENPLGPSPLAVRAARACLNQVHRYPDPAGTSLKRKLAEKTGLTPAHFLLGNGAAEVIDLAAMAFIQPGDRVVLSSLTFPKYILSARRMMGEVVRVPMRDFNHDTQALLAEADSGAKLMFLDNPCNPVGCLLTKGRQEELLWNLPDRMVLVMDEAYREFASAADCLDYRSVLQDRSNLLFLRTFSKSYGLSGLRIGYAVGHPELISDLERVREVFNVNALALAAAEAALDDDEHLRKTLLVNDRGKNYLYRHLRRLGFWFRETCANFILIDTRRSLAQVEEFFLRQGIIIRPIRAPEAGGGFIRVSIGRPVDNRAFIRALERLAGAVAPSAGSSSAS